MLGVSVVNMLGRTHLNTMKLISAKRSNPILRKLANRGALDLARVEKAAAKIVKENPEIEILHLAEAAEKAASLDKSYGLATLTTDEACALVMVELYERNHDEVSSPYPQSEGENK